MPTHDTIGFFGRLTVTLIKRRLWVLTLIAMMSGYLGFHALRVEFNTANEYFFLENDEFLVRYNDFKKTFGSDEYTYAIVTFDDVFTPESLKALSRFVEAVRDEIPYTESIQSILDVDRIKSDDFSIVVEPFFESEEQYDDLALLKSRRQEALSNPAYVDFLVSKNGKFAGVFVEHELREGDGEFRKEICKRFRSLVDRPEFAALNIKVVGSTILDAELDSILAKESRLFATVSCVLIFLVILLSFRKFNLVISPFIVIVVTDVWVIGLMSLLGYPLTMMSLVLPSVIVVVGCGDAIHFISEFRSKMNELGERKAALIAAADLTGLPCLFTSLTTMIGFGSLMAMELRPGKEMGMFAAVGVVVAFVMTFLLLPPLISLGISKDKPGAYESKGLTQAYTGLLNFIADFSIKARKPILVCGLVLFALGIWGLSRVQVSADFLRILDEDTRVRQDYDYVDRSLGGTSSFQVVVDTGEVDGIFDPVRLKELDRLNAWLLAHEDVRSTQGILDVFKELMKVGHDGDEAFYKIPESRPEASQLFLLYEMGGAEQIEKLLTDERDRARIIVRTPSLSTATAERLITDLEDWSKRELKTITVQSTGMSPLFVRMVHFITKGQVMSFGLAFIFVGLCMAAVFRSVSLGLLAMIPNVFPIALTFGVMGFTGTSLNLGTVMIASIAIGIAVDDSIHFVSHYRRHLQNGLAPEAAIRATTTGVGMALLNTSVVLVLGFSVFGLSDVSHLVNFGLLTALTVVTALLADFLLLPAVILSFIGQSEA